MIKSIAIIGGGQLGSRHLQGLAMSSKHYRINVVDPNKKALAIAKQRYFEVSKKQNVRVVENGAKEETQAWTYLQWVRNKKVQHTSVRLHHKKRNPTSQICLALTTLDRSKTAFNMHRSAKNHRF